MAKRAGLKSLTICNVDNSSIVRESDISILTRAGIEKGLQAQRHLLPKLWSYGSLLYILAQLKETSPKDRLRDEISSTHGI